MEIIRNKLHTRIQIDQSVIIVILVVINLQSKEVLVLKRFIRFVCITLVFISLCLSLPVNSNAKEKSKAYVYIGDSRTVGMNNVVEMDKRKDTFVIAKSGMGYAWLVDTAIPELEKIQKNNNYDRYIIIFNLGVNDLGNIDKYIEIVPKLQNYGELYYVSINPTVDAVGGIQCKSIEKFNNAIIAEEKHINYVNSYSYLKKIGYYAEDGMHYDEETYINLY